MKTVKKSVKIGKSIKKTGKTPNQVKTHFSSKNQPPNAGRKKSILKYLEEYKGDDYKIELSKEEKMRIIEAMLEKSQPEIIAIYQDLGRPVFVRMVAMAIKTEMENGDLQIFGRILDRIHGKPEQVTTHLGAGGGPIQVQHSVKTPAEAARVYIDRVKNGRKQIMAT